MKYILTESQLKKIIKEDNFNKRPPITLEVIKETIFDELGNYGIEYRKPSVKRRIYLKVTQLAEDIYDSFSSRLDYMSEEGGFQDLLSKLRD